MLWPNPGPPLTTEAPVHWPGISPASTAMLREYLQRDYREHHAYFNERGFHNHTPFHLLVEWVLGGTPPHLTAIWNQHIKVERKQFASPNPITEETFFDHLGDENYYQAYLYFFSDLVLRKPVERVLEEWLLDRKVNFDCEKPGAREDGMLNRLFAGVMHPLIYVGYGLEFSLPGLVAEGLAQAAVHKNATSTLLPQYMFATSPPPTPSSTRSRGLHAFTILARIQRDRRFDNVTPKFKFDDIHKQYGEDIQRYANEWVVEGVSEKEVKGKVRELVFLNVMIYAMGGWNDGEGFRYAEFTLMHLVTSSITLSSYMASLSSPSSKSILLRAYLSRSLAYWISRGRPILNPRSFFACPLHSPSTIPTIPNPKPTPNPSAFPAPTSPDALTPNPWLQIIQSALVHPDDHLGKFQRTLAYYGALYGGVEGGAFGKGETELEGCEVVDGTLFLRAAGVTMLRMGRVREGEKSEYWTNDPNFESSFASLT
ncbi:hypothetical protein R3P38DRAFT_3328001 [Favolaschia claudopus]|uniref:Uncharacterized protein n=1 Tax=Favolaschia claudopus TaxID=2862362 RepID=A0AAW0A2P3_9AGAR